MYAITASSFGPDVVRPAAVANIYHAACGNHCSAQRQSESWWVISYGTFRSIPWSSLYPDVTPLQMPPGALLYSQLAKKRYSGLLWPVPCNMLASNGFKPKIQFNWSSAYACNCAWNAGSSTYRGAARRAAAASEARRAFSPCHHGLVSESCG